jgi:hypothetical protein
MFEIRSRNEWMRPVRVVVMAKNLKDKISTAFTVRSKH